MTPCQAYYVKEIWLWIDNEMRLLYLLIFFEHVGLGLRCPQQNYRYNIKERKKSWQEMKNYFLCLKFDLCDTLADQV